ncbi:MULTISPECIES: DUF3021 domain-containing protein [unclassified Bifidobacterium]|uniref:DUF3021 domain-containing protein n=1 Tax=unclassified Bifidobacterium TaxID=2608897 RepID=UPI0023F76F17|nr:MULTISPECIES: DUF3021 domain-containing protein [unclassified Bifidobacterium]WEV65699.1 DUF3021 domain-containing protein [Bifidobacterium sp. ESL0764]WEV75513.1 DUF3021 domain-containing protein [Bifidobacterium sp. ESL0800]
MLEENDKVGNSVSGDRSERSLQSGETERREAKDGNMRNGRSHTPGKSNLRVSHHGQQGILHDPLSQILYHLFAAIAVGTVMLVVFELIVPNWIPINRMSIITLLGPEIVVGLLDYLLFHVEVSLSIAIPVHCVCTFAAFSAWVFVNGWTIVFREQLVYFILSFVVIYALVWLGLIVYYKFVAWEINRSVAERFNRRQGRQ